jgi:hypothetical protein
LLLTKTHVWGSENVVECGQILTKRGDERDVVVHKEKLSILEGKKLKMPLFFSYFVSFYDDQYLQKAHFCNFKK